MTSCTIPAARPEIPPGPSLAPEQFRAVLARLAAAAAEAAISRLRAVTQAHNLPVRHLIASSGRPYTARFAGAEVLYEVAL